MGQALYRKYRSKKFSEVVDQDHITSTLEKAIKNGRVSHAYLFTGPRGVGKTTVARILAHEVNALPYSDESIHLDIIEIDAASNRRIDEVRDLREKVHIAPTSAKYKVYIIDEVHMLTREAFNALLKTLEEPPEHCIFILATTEAHKLPETIVSRTQRFNFKPIDNEAAKNHLSAMAKSENIIIEPAALELLAEHGRGSFRDSISLLDQLSSAGTKITADTVKQFLGLPPQGVIDGLASGISAGDASAVLEAVEELKSQGVDATLAARSLSARLRGDLTTQSGTSALVAGLLRALLEVPASDYPYDSLEIAALEAANGSKGLNHSQEKLEAKAAMSAKPPAVVSAPPASPAAKIQPDDEFDLGDWDKIESAIKAQAASLYTALRLATPRLENGGLTLAFRFPLHQKKVSRAANLKIIEAAIEEVTGRRIKVESTVEPQQRSMANEVVNEQPAKTITNIFGSAEVIES